VQNYNGIAERLATEKFPCISRCFWYAVPVWLAGQTCCTGFEGRVLASPQGALQPHPVLNHSVAGVAMHFHANSQLLRKDGSQKLWHCGMGHRSYKYDNLGVSTYRTGRSPPLGPDFA